MRAYKGYKGNIIEIFFKWGLYLLVGYIMFNILRTNWFVFMLICIIIIMANPGYFKE